MNLALFAYDIVLFPGTPLPLQFFEPRYVEMASDVVAGSGEFGVVLAAPGSILEKEVPSPYGTVARVLDSARLADGRWLVQTVGTSRFRVKSETGRAPYLTAEVELVEEAPGNDLRAYALRDSAVLKLRRLAALAAEAEIPAPPVTIAIDEDPGRASYQIANIIGLDNPGKQRLLETEHDDDRLAAVVMLLDVATTEIERTLARG